jgi:hypothetical protein
VMVPVFVSLYIPWFSSVSWLGCEVCQLLQLCVYVFALSPHPIPSPSHPWGGGLLGSESARVKLHVTN